LGGGINTTGFGLPSSLNTTMHMSTNIVPAFNDHHNHQRNLSNTLKPIQDQTTLDAFGGGFTDGGTTFREIRGIKSGETLISGSSPKEKENSDRNINQILSQASIGLSRRRNNQELEANIASNRSNEFVRGAFQ